MPAAIPALLMVAPLHLIMRQQQGDIACHNQCVQYVAMGQQAQWEGRSVCSRQRT